jgi:hypothetical protein
LLLSTSLPGHLNRELFTSPGGEEKDEHFRLWFLEIVDHVSSVGDVGGAVESEEGVLAEVHEIFEDVYHFGHLAEDEHFVTVFLLFLEDGIQFAQLGRISNEVAEVDDLDVGERFAAADNSWEGVLVIAEAVLVELRILALEDESLELVVVEQFEVLIEGDR